MDTYVHIHIEEPTDEHYSTRPLVTPLSESFYINFRYTEVMDTPSYFTNSQIHVTTTSFNWSFWVPWFILCNCDEFEVSDPDSFTMAYLRSVFYPTPISSQTLDSILPAMGEYANWMIEHNYEGRNTLEMNVTVNVRTSSRDDHEQIGRHDVSVAGPVNSLELVGTEDDASSWSCEQCAICLEEFSDDSEKKLVRTNCLHLFHEECIVQWFQHCSTKQSYSCPLCRRQISS